MTRAMDGIAGNLRLSSISIFAPSWLTTVDGPPIALTAWPAAARKVV
jgi:hypothetical protein